MSNTFFQGEAQILSGETKPPTPLLVKALIIGNIFFLFYKFALSSTFFLPPTLSGVPEPGGCDAVSQYWNMLACSLG